MRAALLQNSASAYGVECVTYVNLKDTFGLVGKAFRVSGPRHVNEMGDGDNGTEKQIG